MDPRTPAANPQLAGHDARRFWRRLVPKDLLPIIKVVVVGAALLPSLFAQESVPPASANPPESIPPTQIALRGEELDRTLRDASRRLPAPSELTALENQFEQQEKDVAASLKDASEVLSNGGTLVEIREYARLWKAYGATETRRRETLSGWGVACDDVIELLAKQRRVWQATLLDATSSGDLQPVLARVRQALADIRAVERTAEERFRIVLEMQGRFSKQALTIAGMLEKLDEAKRQFQSRLLSADAPPIWQAKAPQDADKQSVTILRRTLTNSAAFASNRRGRLAANLLLLAIAFAAVRKLARATAARKSLDPELAPANALLRRPVSVAVLMIAPVVFMELPLARLAVALLTIQLFLIPVVRLLPLLPGIHKRLLYFFALFYVANSIVGLVNVDPLFGRALNVGLFAATFAVFGWWAWSGRMFGATRSDFTFRHVLIVRASLVASGLILAANAFGFIVLSNLLRLTFLLSSQIGLVIYAFVRVTSILPAAAFRLPRFRRFATVRLHEQAVVAWVERLLTASGVLCWIYLTSDLLALKEDLFNAISAISGVRLGIKAFSISLGDLLELLFVLAFGYLAARAIRFILREEVLARLRLSRGVPDLIATTFYYVMLVVVFLMSLTMAGVQLDKLTVLTGALGVGVGFGLQNVVNNFVSGLILKFERPIRVGDVLEMGGLAGEVHRIGSRASTIRTFQGAEVIVPNSALVSNQVVNWTLSESRRRVDIAVRVAYGTEPEHVIAILSKVASDHPEVLKDPAPGAFFQSFGESGMDFVLMFWAEQDTHFRLRSEVSIGINAALREAGIEIPYPQRDLHLRSVEAPAAQEAPTISDLRRFSTP